MGVDVFYTQAWSLQVEIFLVETIENRLAFEELLARTNVKLTYAHEKKGALQRQLEMCKFFAKEKQKKCFIG
jgi:hypothetical protein